MTDLDRPAARSGDQQVLLHGSFYRAGRRGWVVAPFVLALVALVCLGVNLAVGAEKLPEGLWDATPWFGAALAVGVALTVVAHLGNVTRLRVVEDPAGAVRAELKDRAEQWTLGPLRFLAGWHWGQLHTGRRAISHPVLELALLDAQGTCRVLLREELGAAYSPPDGWPEGALHVRPERLLFASLGRVHLDRLAQELDRRGLRA